MSKVMNIKLGDEKKKKFKATCKITIFKITYNSKIFKSKEIDLRGGKFIREGGHYVIPINRLAILAI